MITGGVWRLWPTVGKTPDPCCMAAQERHRIIRNMDNIMDDRLVDAYAASDIGRQPCGTRALSSFCLGIALSVSACSTIQNHPDAAVGAGVGCIAGYGACLLAKGNPAICAAACVGGAVIGVGVGVYLDRRRERLAQVAKSQGLKLSSVDVAIASAGPPAPAGPAPAQPPQRSAGGYSAGGTRSNGLVTEINVDQMFATGSSNPTPQAAVKLAEIAKVYAERTDQQGHKLDTRLLITGHTDATGNPASNQQLAETRARSIASLFVSSGIPTADLYIKGAGSAQPVADNDTESGRARNRRVEVLEIDTEKDLLAYSVARRQDRESLSFTTKIGANAPPGTNATAGNARSSSPAELHKSAGAPATPPASNRRPAAAGPVSNAGDLLVLGGRPASVTENDVLSKIGPPPPRFSWRSLGVPAAVAAGTVRACYLDQPRVDGEVFKLADGKPLQSHATRDYLPGMYGGGWGGPVGNATLGIAPVAILRDDAVPTGNPKVYLQAVHENAPSEFSAIVNTYEGENGVMLRVYLQGTGRPITCFDIALPKSGEFRSPAGYVFYQDASSGPAWLQADYRPLLERPH